ncbi:Glucosylglycerate phosphorylase [subsurface metagenome]
MASHDGVGVLPAHGILSNDELAGLGRLASEHGGYVSYKATPDGEIPYELNISYLNAIAHPEEEISIKAAKFLTSQAVMLALSGVPGIYVHSILGTENYRTGVEHTGMKRSINRRKFDLAEIESELSRSGSLQAVIFEGYLSLLKARRANSAFHPFAEQRLLKGGKALFSLLRVSRDKSRKILCIHNTGAQKCLFTGPVSLLSSPATDSAIDVISGNTIRVSRKKSSGEIEIPVDPYQTLWLKV